MTIEKLVAAINKAIADENHYAALVLSLTMPDICGKLEFPKVSSSERIKNWFDKYLKKHNERIIPSGQTITFMTASDFYALRCAILHEASEDLTGQKAHEVLSKIKFTTLNSHRNRIGSILALNVERFCEEINQGVSEWLVDVSSNTEVMERINKLIKIEETLFSPAPGITFG